MSKGKRKNRNQKDTSKVIFLIPVTIQLVTAIINLIREVMS